MRITQTIAPASTIVSLAEAKSFLRVLTNDDDSLISILIEAATNYAENYTSRQLISAKYRVVVNRSELFELQKNSYFNGLIEVNKPLRLPKSPIISIDSVKVSDSTGTFSTLDNVNYTVDYDVDVAVFTLTQQLSDAKSFQIDFTAGFDIVPPVLKAWALNKIATLFEFREALIDSKLSEMPSNVIDCVLDQFKVQYL